MSYLEDKVNSLQDSEYRKALTYTVGNAAITGAFGLASIERALDGDIDTASKTAAVAGFSGTLAKGCYNRTQELEEEINEDIFDDDGDNNNEVNDYDLDLYSAD